MLFFLEWWFQLVLVLGFGGGVNNDASVLGKWLAGALKNSIKKLEKGVSVRARVFRANSTYPLSI
jgi:hypothetical protein